VDKVIEMSKELDAELVVVGEGPAKEALKNKADGDVVFKDFLDRENLPGYYSALDIFVTASTGDTLGLSCLEANACGTPVVAPDVHPFDKTIKEGENGFNYKSGDKEDFKQKVISALNSSWSTRKSVKEYSLEKSINQLENLYQELEG
jgi:glycosyltransferase involved in cell wall biosynthesis